MSSGYGLSGGPSRCFPFWQEVLACYVINTNSEDVSGKKKCQPVLEDYYECLHHRKEAVKISALQAAYRKRELATARDDAPSADQVRSLGLLENLEKEKEKVDVRPAASFLAGAQSNLPQAAK